YRVEGKKAKKLEFFYNTLIDDSKAKEKALSQKYIIEYAYLYAHDEIVDEDDQKLRQNNFEVKSTGELDAVTFFDIINRLYSFHFTSAYLILKDLVSDKTILIDDIPVRNVNNFITR
ncbi:MAG: hypothetical protein RSF02_02480, partial [Bacilli bacterium]